MLSVFDDNRPIIEQSSFNRTTVFLLPENKVFSTSFGQTIGEHATTTVITNQVVLAI